jgi:hypothetical protein
LGIAFVLGRRAAARCYTYGFGRAEDLAGVIAVSAAAGYCTRPACSCYSSAKIRSTLDVLRYVRWFVY